MTDEDLVARLLNRMINLAHSTDEKVSYDATSFMLERLGKQTKPPPNEGVGGVITVQQANEYLERNGYASRLLEARAPGVRSSITKLDVVWVDPGAVGIQHAFQQALGGGLMGDR